MEIFGNEEYEFPVHEVWKFLKGVEYHLIPLEDLRHCLTYPVWGRPDPIIPDQLYTLHESQGDVLGHRELVEQADLRYPIELWPLELYGGLIVANGYHRLLKADRLGLKTIRARHIPMEFMERGKIL